MALICSSLLWLLWKFYYLDIPVIGVGRGDSGKMRCSGVGGWGVVVVVQKRLQARKTLLFNKQHIFQCMDKILCVEFQKVPLKFHTKYLTHTLKDAIFTQC